LQKFDFPAEKDVYYKPLIKLKSRLRNADILVTCLEHRRVAGTKEAVKMLEKNFRRVRKGHPRAHADKDILVKAVRHKRQRDVTEEEEIDLIKEYEKELKLSNKFNAVQGLTVGTGVGMLVCVLAAATGITLAVRDMVTLISVPAMLGMIAGYVLS